MGPLGPRMSRLCALRGSQRWTTYRSLLRRSPAGRRCIPGRASHPPTEPSKPTETSTGDPSISKRQRTPPARRFGRRAAASMRTERGAVRAITVTTYGRAGPIGRSRQSRLIRRGALMTLCSMGQRWVNKGTPVRPKAPEPVPLNYAASPPLPRGRESAVIHS